MKQWPQWSIAFGVLILMSRGCTQRTEQESSATRDITATPVTMIPTALNTPVQATPAALEQGQIAYRTHCLSCHGQWGEGLSAPSLNLCATCSSPEGVSQHLQRPSGSHQAVNCSEACLRDVVAYVSTRFGKNTLYGTGTLSISAFNVQIFGQSKIQQPEVVATLVRIFRRYDIALIQEIRDSTGTAIQSLLDQINQVNGPGYALALGDRIGRTSSKEQYAYFYRTDTVTLHALRTYPDETQDVFEREPLEALFQANQIRITLVGIHTSPSRAVAEIQALFDVAEQIRQQWGESHVLILGDLNADCSYVSANDWSKISLRQDQRFQWWIDDTEDTTTATTQCAYDRFVSTESLTPSILSASVFRFDQAYGLSQDLVRQVSDHYPIQMGIKLGSME